MERVVIGRIGRAHGIRGDLTVELRTDEPERRFASGETIWAGDCQLTITSSRPYQGRLLVSFAGVADRTAAETLHGAVLEVEVDPRELPQEADAYYDRQLVGLAAITPDGSVIGSVTEVVHLPAHDLLVLDAAGREVMVPFVEALVPQVDVQAGTLTIADVPGLIDPEQADEAR